MRKYIRHIKNLLQPRPKHLAIPYGNISWSPTGDFTVEEKNIISLVSPFTMTGPEKLIALIRAIEYLHRNAIPGSIVECGVWKGGSVMAALLKLVELGDREREVFLYDTFEGMNEPSGNDIDLLGNRADELLRAKGKNDPSSLWCFSPLDEVKKNILSTGYPANKLHFIKGEVEKTLLADTPGPIALLRLDTDWYGSTKVELECLYPKIVAGGILILDDYGHWAGSRKAVDEYIARHKIPLFLSRIDFSARIAVKR